jgi:tellurite resistance protein
MLGATPPMDQDVRINLLARVARSASAPGKPVDPAKPVSILSLAAASYGARPSEDATVPTGFDPLAVALFEAIVEGAYLVAHADGVFDDAERLTFERVVVAACGGTVAPEQIAALVSDLTDQLAEDGMERRIEALSRTVTKREHALEVLRIAALLAQTSDDVSAVERDVLTSIAKHTGLAPSDVDVALHDVKEALSGA